MNNILILFIFLILLFSGISYIATNSVLVLVIVAIISSAYFFLLALPKLNKYLLSSKRFHAAFTFINSFIVSLSVKGSLIAAFEYVRLNMDEEYKVIMEGLSNLNEDEKLDYLKKYYNFDIYYLFLSVIKIYIEQGGDILSLSPYLISEARRNEDYIIKVESYAKHKAIDFAILWIFTLIILVVLRFALSQFFSYISSLIFYQILVIFLFLFVLVSIHIFINKVIHLDIKGFNYV